jgi:hypothetical protein
MAGKRGTPAKARQAPAEPNACPTPRCGEKLNEGEFVCRFCFRKLPEEIKRRLKRCVAGTPGYDHARRITLQWLRSHHDERPAPVYR